MDGHHPEQVWQQRERDETKTTETKNNTKRKPIGEDKENMLKRKVIMESDEYNEP